MVPTPIKHNTKKATPRPIPIHIENLDEARLLEVDCAPTTGATVGLGLNKLGDETIT